MRFYKKIMRVFTFVVCISIFTVVANGYTMPEPLTCNWANPRAGGEVSVLFICSVDQQYEVMVLADSFDLTYDIAPLRPAQSASAAQYKLRSRLLALPKLRARRCKTRSPQTCCRGRSGRCCPC